MLATYCMGSLYAALHPIYSSHETDVDIEFATAGLLGRILVAWLSMALMDIYNMWI